MKSLSKICDAADWFDPELIDVITTELEETPRLHRKQWEFGMIFLTLKKLGMITPDSRGLSMGGGNERVLYSLARRIKKLSVTDLYESDTSWDTARTNNAENFILSSKPFEVDSSKLDVRVMDMRNLQFPDNYFDFCYSSCSFEHIGHFNDFLKHLNEAYRVLKNNGVYVFTTEFVFSDETIKDPNNYLFSADYLEELFKEMNFSLAALPDLTLTRHESNYPRAANLTNLFYNNIRNTDSYFSNIIPHTHLLRGKYPFTSILFILRKQTKKEETTKNIFSRNILSETKSFLLSGVKKYQESIQNSGLNLYPFSVLPDELSPYFLDHAEFFTKSNSANSDGTLFHTDYCWFGSGMRKIKIEINIADIISEIPLKINLRIHSYAVLSSESITCEAEYPLNMNEPGLITKEFEIYFSEERCYAFLSKLTEGNFTSNRIKITIEPANNSHSGEPNRQKQLNVAE